MLLPFLDDMAKMQLFIGTQEWDAADRPQIIADGIRAALGGAWRGRHGRKEFGVIAECPKSSCLLAESDECKMIDSIAIFIEMCAFWLLRCGFAA